MNKAVYSISMCKKYFIRRQAMIIVASLASILSLASCKKKTPAPAPPPPEIICVAAVKQEIANSFNFIGQTVAEESVSIVPMVEGYLIKQGFDEGSIVKKGDLLFEIDPRPFQAQVKNAEGQLAAAKAQMINAQIEYNRYTKLIHESATSQQNQDKAIMDKGNAEGQLLIAQASLDTAKINLGYTQLRAPFDGKISVCPISVGNLVGSPANRQPLTSIMQMNPMKVEFNVPETAVATVIEKFGSIDRACKLMSAEIILPNGALYPHNGNIYFIDNQISANTGTIRQRARFPNPDSVLTPNEYVTIRVFFKEKKPVILVPQIALVEDMTGTLVMMVKDGKVERRQVKTGQNHGQDIEIVSGVAEGDWVVTAGLLKIRNGMTVNAKLDKPATVPKNKE